MGHCCPPNFPTSTPILFFPISTETPTANLIGAGEVPVLTLGASPSSVGSHLVKIDSTVELVINTVSATNSYQVVYRLRRSDQVSPLATLGVIRRTSSNLPGQVHTQIPNLTWNDTLLGAVTYSITLEVTESVGINSVVANTRALNVIVF